MFSNTIDKKKEIIDPNGNAIIDLTTSIFADEVTSQTPTNIKRLSGFYQMRADKASFAEYGSEEQTEFVLKYSGVSNPFSLDKDDLLLFPDQSIAKAQMKDMSAKAKNSRIQQIKNYFKFSNTDFKSNRDSYDALDNLEIPSGIPTARPEDAYQVPYIADDGTASITIRNGRMYFGEDNTGTVSNMDEKIKSIIDSTASALADKCVINGISLADFTRANTTK